MVNDSFCKYLKPHTNDLANRPADSKISNYSDCIKDWQSVKYKVGICWTLILLSACYFAWSWSSVRGLKFHQSLYYIMQSTWFANLINSFHMKRDRYNFSETICWMSALRLHVLYFFRYCFTVRRWVNCEWLMIN